MSRELNVMEEEDKSRCPYCGKEYTSDMVVGTTKTFKRGVRESFDVVVCTCGKIIRGTRKSVETVRRN